MLELVVGGGFSFVSEEVQCDFWGWLKNFEIDNAG